MQARSLPNPQVFTAFLNEYVKIRELKWNSTVGWLQSWFNDSASAKIGDSVFMNNKFYQAEKLKTVDGWIELLSDLGKAAREQSLLSATYHAIRTYAISRLLESHLGEEFQAKVTELSNTNAELDSKITLLILNKGTRETVKESTNQYNANLLLLSDLGDDASICKAVRAGLFTHLEHPNRRNVALPYLNTLNENIPFFYHENYYLIHFELFYRSQKHLQMSFGDFEKTSAAGSIKDIIMPNENPLTHNGGGVSQAINTIFGSIPNLVRKQPAPAAVGTTSTSLVSSATRLTRSNTNNE